MSLLLYYERSFKKNVSLHKKTEECGKIIGVIQQGFAQYDILGKRDEHQIELLNTITQERGLLK